MNLRGILLAAAVLGVVAPPAFPEDPPPGLVLTTEVKPAQAAFGDTVQVICTLANTTKDKTFDVLPISLDIWSAFIRVEWSVPQPAPPPEPGKERKPPPKPKIEGYNVIRYVPRVGAITPLARAPLKPGASITSTIPLLCVRTGEQSVIAQYNGFHPSPSTPLQGSPAKLVVSGKGPFVARFETSAGAFEAELLADKAPTTVTNFVTLVRQGYYDGTPFHKLIPGAYLQGGAPKGDPAAGPGWTIPLERSDLPHDLGVLSMARGSDPHSGGGQFFFALAPLPQYDGKAGFACAAFGKVSGKGLDVLKALGKTEVAGRPPEGPDGDPWRPTTPLTVQKVTVVVR